MSLEIIKATTKHAAEICRMLAVQLIEHKVEISGEWLLASIDGVFKDPKRGFFLVAIRDGACVGVAYVSFIWALEHGGHSGWLEELYVEPASRVGGVGTKLLERVLEECTLQGCSALDIEIDSQHERVRSLYERQGFLPLSRSRMAKKLN